MRIEGILQMIHGCCQTFRRRMGQERSFMQRMSDQGGALPSHELCGCTGPTSMHNKDSELTALTHPRTQGLPLSSRYAPMPRLIFLSDCHTPTGTRHPCCRWQWKHRPNFRNCILHTPNAKGKREEYRVGIECDADTEDGIRGGFLDVRPAGHFQLVGMRRLEGFVLFQE